MHIFFHKTIPKRAAPIASQPEVSLVDVVPKAPPRESSRHHSIRSWLLFKFGDPPGMGAGSDRPPSLPGVVPPGPFRSGSRPEKIFFWFFFLPNFFEPYGFFPVPRDPHLPPPLRGGGSSPTPPFEWVPAASPRVLKRSLIQSRDRRLGTLLRFRGGELVLTAPCVTLRSPEEGGFVPKGQ